MPVMPCASCLHPCSVCVCMLWSIGQTGFLQQEVPGHDHTEHCHAVSYHLEATCPQSPPTPYLYNSALVPSHTS